VPVKLGLFGGTFNPIHSGHIKAAEQVTEMLNLHGICFIPSNIPPHKENNDLAESAHRYKMVELAIEDHKNFSVSDYEITKKQKCYTIDTLRHFKHEYPDDELYFIVGHDIFEPIETWKDYKDLFELANFIVISRPGFTDAEQALPLAIEDDFRYYKQQSQIIYFKHKNSNLIIRIEIEGLDISSSQIRQNIRTGKLIDKLVPPKVQQYIFDHNLYA